MFFALLCHVCHGRHGLFAFEKILVVGSFLYPAVVPGVNVSCQVSDRLTGFSIRSERDIGVSVSYDAVSEVCLAAIGCLAFRAQLERLCFVPTRSWRVYDILTVPYVSACLCASDLSGSRLFVPAASGSVFWIPNCKQHRPGLAIPRAPVRQGVLLPKQVMVGRDCGITFNVSVQVVRLSCHRA